MTRNRILRWTLGVSLLFAAPVVGQQQKPVSESERERSDATVRGVRPAEPETPATNSLAARGNQALGPRLVKFSGVLTELSRTSSSAPVEMTFALYKDEVGGEALWTETQSAEVDKEGRYTVLLGATQAEGLPVELFSSEEPRWLGVEIRGQAPQPRMLLVSVPYALKALDAEKLDGKSVSDFVLSESLGEQVRQVIQAQGQVAGQSTLAGTSSTTTTSTSSPGPKFPPSTFSGTTTNQIVLVQQNGTGQGLAAFTGATGGAAVSGIAANPSAGMGVYGQGSNFAGVFGNAVVNSGPAAGVFGTTTSPDGAGVNGVNTSATGFATGVTGFTPSMNGNAVFGSAGSTSGFANGVFGETASPGGNGVLGIATATSGSATGVNGQSSSPAGNGVTGVATATSGSPNGVFGQISSTNGAGVLGVATAATGFNNGVFGATFSNEGTGVSGAASSTSGNANGVVGTSVSTGGGIGVWGISSPASGFGVGVRGDLESPNASGAAGLFLTVSPTSVAGQFANFSRQGLILQGLSGPFDATQKEVFTVDSSGNLHITGNLIVDGTKSSTAKLQSGREVALYAVESPENWFEDFGSAELNNGVAWVPLDASFSQAVNATVAYHVFLTPNGDSNGLYVARKTAAGFEIREHGGGTSNVAFDYRIVARRRGYEAIRMLQVPERKTLETFAQHVELATNRPKAEPVKVPPISLERITPPSTVRPVPPRPIVPQAPKAKVLQPPQSK